MIALITTITLIFEYTILDFLFSENKNFIKNVTFGISSFLFMFLIISEILFAFNYYSLFKTYLICGGIAFIIIISLFFLRYRGDIKHLTQKNKQVVPFELYIILIFGFLLSVNRFELFGMGQDQGVYQIKAILMTEGDNDNYFTVKENELIKNESDKEKLHEFIKLGKAGLGFYPLESNNNRGTIAIEENNPYTGIFHGLPNFPALLSLSGKIFGIQGIMYIPALFYLLSIVTIFLICHFNLELKRSTSGIITSLFMLSPIVVWVSKSALTEIVLTSIILTFIYFITSKEESYKKLLWFPITVFSFTHVSIYTLMPMFVVVFVILMIREREKCYITAGIISIISYLVGLIVMGFTSPQYTFDNYRPLLNLIHAYPDAAHTFPIALIGAVSALVILASLYIFSRKSDFIMMKPINILNVFKMLIVIGILVIIVRWVAISYHAAYDVRWNYYKNKGLLGSLQNITIFAYIIWSGVVLIPINLLSILKLQEKNIISKRLIPIIFMFIYCIIFYSAFLRFDIQYYYYYSRYLAPFLPIAFILGGYFIDHYLKLKVLIGIISFVIFSPFTLNLALYDDISLVDFHSFIKTYEEVLSIEEKSTVVIEDRLSPYFYYPLDSQPDLYVFSDNLLWQMQDISFLDGKKLFYLSTRELPTLPIWSNSMKSSKIGIGGETRITDLFIRKEEKKEVYLYELSAEEFKTPPFDISSFGSQNGSLDKSVLISNGSSGFVLYGNYQELNAGNYEYTFEIYLLDNKSGNNELGHIDVVSDLGETEHVEIPLTLDNVKNQRGTMKLPFRLVEQGQDIEGRVYVNEGVKLKVGYVRLKEVSGN